MDINTITSKYTTQRNILKLENKKHETLQSNKQENKRG